MKPLRTITQLSAIAGLSLTAYGFFTDAFRLWETFPLVVFFFWAHVYAHAEINM